MFRQLLLTMMPAGCVAVNREWDWKRAIRMVIAFDPFCVFLYACVCVYILFAQSFSAHWCLTELGVLGVQHIYMALGREGELR